MVSMRRVLRKKKRHKRKSTEITFTNVMKRERIDNHLTFKSEYMEVIQTNSQ